MPGMLCRGQAGSTDGQAGERVFGVHLRAPYRLRSADDLKYPFSNYVRGYTGLLDYIWYEPEQLEVQVSPTSCIHALHATWHAHCATVLRSPWRVLLHVHLLCHLWSCFLACVCSRNVLSVGHGAIWHFYRHMSMYLANCIQIGVLTGCALCPGAPAHTLGTGAAGLDSLSALPLRPPLSCL